MEKDERAILLGKKITELRESKRLSIRKFSKIIGISDTALAKIETGSTKSITVYLGYCIAKALEVSFNELFDIEVPVIANNEERLVEKIEHLTKVNADQKQLLELRDEIMKSFAQSNILIRNQSFIIIDNAISNTIDELSKIYKDAGIQISVSELKNKIISQSHSEFIDFFIVQAQDMAGNVKKD